MSRFTALISLFGFASAVPAWPPLPQSGFITERPATVEDVKQGNAVFAIGSDSKSVHIQIPQYVLWTDETGEEHPMILVQAEQGPDATTVVGLRDFDGKETVATLAEVKLLGTKKRK